MINLRPSRGLWTAIVLVAMAVPAFAHHSFVMFDQGKQITLKGKVSEFYWLNPHGHIILQVAAAPGVDPAMVGEWDVECAATNIMARQGWTSTTLKAGEEITLVGNPLRDGDKGASLFYVILPDGKRLYRDIARPKAGATN